MEAKLQNIYVSKLEKSGKTSGNLALKVKRWMDAETWFTAQEALDAGFIEEIQEATKQANIIQMQPALARYVNVPAALFNNQKPEDILNADLYFMSKIGMERFIGTQRSNGFAAMIKQMKLYALAFKTQTELAK